MPDAALVSDFISWRGLRLERRKEYPHERYDYVAMGGAWWIVERLPASQGWLVTFIAGERVRFMGLGETPTEALEGSYAEVMKLDEQLRQTLGEMKPDDREQ